MPGSSNKHPETRCRTCRRRRRVSGITGRCLLCEAQAPRLLEDSRSDNSAAVMGKGPALTSPSATTFDQGRSIKKHNAQREVARFSIPHVSHRAVERSQLLDSFITSTFPSLDATGTDLARQQSVLMILRNFDLAMSPLLSEAVETVCLEAVARAAGADETTLSYKAQGSYVQLLRRLNSALEPSSKVQRQSRGNHIAVAIMLILLRTSVADSTDAKSIIMHRNGLHQFLYTRAQAFDWSNLATRGMFENFRLQTILLRVGCPQKAQGLRMPPWTVPSKDATSGLPEMVWHVEAEHLPDLLDRVGILCQPETRSSTAAARLYVELEDLRRRLTPFEPFSADQNDRVDTGIDTVCDASDREVFDVSIEEHCCMSASNTYTMFYRFNTHSQARNSACAWLSALLTDTAILRLLHVYPVLYNQVSFGDLVASALSTAQNLCRCTWYFANFSTSIAHAEFIQVLLLAAQGAFEAGGAAAEYNWTQTCLVATELRIQRLRDAGRTTFCHVREVKEDIKRRCLWTGS